MMCLTLRLSIVLFIFNVGVLFSCKTRSHDKKEIELAMKQYDHLIQKMDIDSIALLYSQNGDLGKMAHGRDSIRKFLSGFSNYKVLSQSSSSESVNIMGDTSLQKGTYHQTVITPAKDTLTVKGTYTATWIWQPQNSWQIRRMETTPLK